MRRGVTLIELLFVIMIVGILAGLGFGFYSTAAAQAKVERTRAIVSKIDQLVTAKWEEYRTRAVPIKIPPYDNGQPVHPIVCARIRLAALRELQKFELPDRISDVAAAPQIIAVLDGKQIMLATPVVQKNYRRRALATWNTSYEGAECLYMIVASMRDGEDSALSFFSPQEIGDVDGDGMKELLDGFGQPIEFLRWAPGYIQENGPVTQQTKDAKKAPDYFDPFHVDPRWTDADITFTPFALRPLVFSPGPDKEYGITTGPATGLVYATTTPPNDPYLAASPPVGSMTGTEAVDNITNHDFGEK